LSRSFAVLVVMLSALACQAGDQLTAAPAEAPVVRALVDSLVIDEARAADRYQRIVSRFGAVAPFRDLSEEPRPRLDALLGVVDRRGWVAPDPFAGPIGVEVYANVAGACDVSARFSRLMIARYDRLLTVAEAADLRAVTRRNRDAASGADLARTTACH
jgi:hypothetical protein